MEIAFLLNGEAVRITGHPPTRTLLDWLRETRHLTGTKEGCNEGDCGACTVMVTTPGPDGPVHRALNACILFLPQLHGKAVRTIEGLAGPDGTLHPVQQAMIAHHGSQCGFCTPGIVMSLAVAHMNGRRDFDDVLAGNLCRCTGYAPIIRAAEAAADQPVPDWLADDLTRLADLVPAPDEHVFQPRSVAELARWYADNPDALLVGGATDIGLWVTKKLADLPALAFLGGIAELQRIEVTDRAITLGAGVTIDRLQELMADHHPDFAEMLRRFGSAQVRAAATLGGNIGNASPIGDTPPALIALGATLILRKGDKTREMPLEDYFLSYGRQDRAPGEFILAVRIPRQPDGLRCYKISKRFDQDISALCGCFNVTLEGNRVTDARIAFGGMAEIPKRARAVEQALIGRPWRDQTVQEAIRMFPRDFTPIDDMRASARYRLTVAGNLLWRYFTETALPGTPTRVREVAP